MTDERAKPSASKILRKWRPSVLQEEAANAPGVKKEGASANGALEVKPVAQES